MTLKAYLAGLAVKPLLIIWLFLAFLVGFFIGGAALHDPDTCWLLGLGRYIYENKALPPIDPFSYTAASRPFVMYQWLSELTFFWAYKAFSLLGVLLLTCFVEISAFAIIPLRYFNRLGIPALQAAALIILAACAAGFHFLARPEIFSYLLLSLWLGNLVMHRRRCYMSVTSTNQPDAPLSTNTGAAPEPGLASASELTTPARPKQLDYRFIACSAAIMLLWVNLHTGFVFGLGLLICYLIANFLIRLFSKHGPYIDYSAAVALAGSLLVSLLNPYGIKLWQYIPKLFFAPFNERIIELLPLNFSDPTFYPALILIAITGIVSFSAIRLPQLTTASRAETLLSLSIIAPAIIVSIQHRRLIPFLALMFLFEIAYVLSIKPKVPDADCGFFAHINRELSTRNAIGSSKWQATAILFALLGTIICSAKIVTPTLPQSSKAFTAPFKAIEFIKEHRPPGNVFNTAQYGDLLIWYTPANPKVFTDTRYDMYGTQIIADYDTIRFAQNGWRQLFASYDVQWVFVPKKSRLLAELDGDPRWRTIYCDDLAVIKSRRRNSSASDGRSK